MAAIAIPTCAFVALEPVHKKQAFLRTAARELALSNLDARAERIEDHGIHDYDAATSRATMDLRDWLALAIQHVHGGGVAIGFEGQRRDDLPSETRRHPYTLNNKQRALVILEKI
jgi:16S rRNA G527 N7-methylase RsmG